MASVACSSDGHYRPRHVGRKMFASAKQRVLIADYAFNWPDTAPYPRFSYDSGTV